MSNGTLDWLTVAQFIARFKGTVSRNFVYERIRDGTIPSVRLGKKILIPVDALDRLLAESRADGLKAWIEKQD